MSPCTTDRTITWSQLICSAAAAMVAMFAESSSVAAATALVRSDVCSLCESNTFETPYFKGRVFSNGNMHLEFKRRDLLKRLNQIAGGRRLRKAS